MIYLMKMFLFKKGDFTYESGFNQMSKLLALNNRPTAVFAANDEMAIGAIKAIKSQGLKFQRTLQLLALIILGFLQFLNHH